MHYSRTLFAAAAAALGALACNSDAPLAPLTSLPYSVATFNCGPVDQTSTQVILSATPINGLTPGDPSLTINVWHARSQLPGTWEVGGTSTHASAYYSAGKAMARPATGIFKVDAGSTQGTVNGEVELFVEGVGTIRGRISAPWVEMFILCG